MLNYVSDENFLLYAAQHYDNPSCKTESEFQDDLSRIKFIQKMFRRYEKDGIINERLILNHLILLYNVFERDAITKMLVLKLRDYLHVLKPFLVLLNFWPDKIMNVGAPSIHIIGSDIPMDKNLVEVLRKI